MDDKAVCSDKDLRWSRRLSFVPRWSVVPTIRQQSVAEHSFHVAQAVLWLLPQHAVWHTGNHMDRTVFESEALKEALLHDLDEAAKGDAPSPSKKPKDAEGMTQVQILVKVADVLEAIGFIHEEKALGNNHGMEVLCMDLAVRLAPYWHAFQFDPTKRKHILSDLIKFYVWNVVPPRAQLAHPGLEEHDA